MADPDVTATGIKALVGIVVGMFGWHYKGQNTRLREIEKTLPTKVDVKTYNDTLNALRNDFKEHAEKVERRIIEHAQAAERSSARTHQRIDDLIQMQAKNRDGN